MFVSEDSKILILLDRITFLSVLSVIFFIPFTKGGIETCVTIGAISWLLCRILKRDFDLRNVPLFIPLCFYFAAVLLSFFNSGIPPLSIKGLLRVAKYGCLYLFAADTIRTEFRIRCVSRAILLTAMLACANGFYQIQTGWDFRHEYSMMIVNGIKRVAGSFNHPNNFAAYLCVVILVSFYLNDKFLWNLLKLITLPFLFYMLFKTNSRAPLILGFLTLSLASLIDRLYRKYSLCFLLFILFGIATYCYLSPEYFKHLIKITSGDARMQYWFISIALIKQHILFGSGPNTFMSIFGNSLPMQIYGNTRFLYAHNFILQMWVEIGLFGLCAFFVFITRFFLRAIQFLSQLSENSLRRTVFGIVVSLVFFLLHSTVDNNLQSLQLTTLFWVLVGSVMGITSIQKSSAGVNH